MFVNQTRLRSLKLNFFSAQRFKYRIHFDLVFFFFICDLAFGFLVVLGIELGASHMLGQHSTTETQP
jgi:hypothetical protein